MKLLFAFASVVITSWAVPSAADEMRTVRVQFAAGASQTVITDKITGDSSVVYKLSARDGQFLKVSLRPDNESADFNIYIPGRAPGEEALFTSATGGREYLGQLYKTGDHSISVFLNRAAARQGQTAHFDLVISITDKAPDEGEPVPAAGEVPQKVIDDCLAALRDQLGDRGMTLISAKRGENSFVVDVQAEGVEKPWRCFHDGTQCTGTEYQGEG